MSELAKNIKIHNFKASALNTYIAFTPTHQFAISCKRMYHRKQPSASCTMHNHYGCHLHQKYSAFIYCLLSQIMKATAAAASQELSRQLVFLCLSYCSSNKSKPNLRSQYLPILLLLLMRSLHQWGKQKANVYSLGFTAMQMCAPALAKKNNIRPSFAPLLYASLVV